MVKFVITKEEFQNVLKDAGDKVVAVDFTASWCGPCKVIGPKFEQLANLYPEIICIKVDVDENEVVAADEGIQAMPTFRFYKQGVQIAEMVGADAEKLKVLFENNK